MVARGARPDPAWPGQIARERAAEGRRARLCPEQFRQSAGSKASIWLFASSAASISASGVAAAAVSTSSAGFILADAGQRGYLQHVLDLHRAAEPRFDPPATSSSGCSSAAAQVTTSLTCFASAAWNAGIERTPSEAGQFGEPHLTAMHVHPAEFGTAMQLRKHLTGIEQTARIERTFEPLLLREIGFVEHRVH